MIFHVQFGINKHLIFSASRRSFPRLSSVLPTSRVFTSGYVNTETILHFFNKKELLKYNYEIKIKI